MNKVVTTAKRTLVALMAAAMVLAIIPAMGSCKNFMKSDDDVKETMEKEVEVANAPEVSIKVLPSDSSLGTTSPMNATTVKVGVDFSLYAIPSAGGFIRWAAYSETDPATELVDVVTFGATNTAAEAAKAETTAKLNVNRSDIQIIALFEIRPAHVSELPNRYSANSVQNSMIRINFNKPLADAAFSFGADTDGDGYTTKENGLFKNIALTMTVGGDVKNLTADYFVAPVLSRDKKSITIKNKAVLPAGRTVMVTLSKEIIDTSGLTMGSDDTYTYTVGSGKDESPPVLSTVLSGLDTNYTLSTGAPETRRIGGQTLYLLMKGEDNAGNGMVDYAEIQASNMSYADNGTLGTTITRPSTNEAWIDDAGTPLVFDAFTLDGLIDIAIKLYDSNGLDSETTHYQLVRDTTAPSVDAAQIARIAMSGSVSSGFYNRFSTISFSQVNTGDPVVDVGFAGDSSIPRLRSATVYYRFGFGADQFTAPDTGWVATSSTATLPISLFGTAESSSVPVYYQLKDDLGNTSAVTPFGTVAIDNSPPVGSVTFNLTATGSNKFTQNVVSLPYTVTATDSMSGVAKYCVRQATGSHASPIAPASPLAGASDWQDYTAGGSSGTITFADALDGQKVIYVWFKDGADNITASPSTDIAIQDGTKPTLENFYLSPSPIPTPGNVPTLSADQYSNSNSFYFAFVADDTNTGASGLSAFSYSDSKGGTPAWFDIRSTAIGVPIGTPPIQVSSMNTATLDSRNGIPTRVLVTGILTVPVENDIHAITLTVKDCAGNESNGLTNGKQIIFDNNPPPALTEVTIDGAAPSVPFYTNVLTHTLTLKGTDFDSGAAVSGINRAVLANVSPSALSSTPSPVFYVSGTTPCAGTAAEGTASTSISFSSGDGYKDFSVNALDYAGNAMATAQTISVILDQAAPKFQLSLANSADTVRAAKLDSTVATTISTDTELSEMTTMRLAISGTDNPVGTSSGFNAGNVHAYTLYKRPVGGGDANDVSQPGKTGTIEPGISNVITMPSTGGKSATWVVGVKAQDVLGNTSTEQKIGYVYDITDPVVPTGESTVKVTLPAGSDSVAKYLRSADPADTNYYYFVPVTAFPGTSDVGVVDLNPTNYDLRIAVNAMDRSSDDLEGSGLANQQVTVKYRMIGNGEDGPYTNSPQTCAESAEVAEASRFVTLRSAAGLDYWSLNAHEYFTYTATLYDAVNNSKTKDTFTVVIDKNQPTVSSTAFVSHSGFVSGTKYVNDSVTFSFTPSDTNDYPLVWPASGVKGYTLDTSATPPAPTGTWTSWTSGPVDKTADFKALVTSSAQHLYLHLCDKAGLRNTYDLGTVKLDKTAPAVSNASFTVKSYTGNKAGVTVGSRIFLDEPTFTITGKVSDRTGTDSAGSGIDTCQWSWSAKTSVASPVDYTSIEQTGLVENGAASEFTVNPQAGSYWNIAPYYYVKLKIDVTDKARNTGTNAATAAASTLEIVCDQITPTGAGTLGTVFDGGVINISSSSTLTLSLSDPTDFAEHPASGVKAWMLVAGTTAPAKPTDTAILGQTTGHTGDWYYDVADASAQLLAKVPASGSTKIYLFVVDNVGHVSNAIVLGGDKYFMKDETPPTVSITTPVTVYPGAGSQDFVNGSAKVSFTVNDGIGGSGVNRYMFSTNETEPAATINAAALDCAAEVSLVSTNALIAVDGYFDASTARKVFLHVTDKAGNVSSYVSGGGVLCPIVTNEAKLDATSPAVTSLAGWSSYWNSVKTVDDDGTLNMKVNYPVSCETASGIDRIVFSGQIKSDLVPLANVKVYQNQDVDDGGATALPSTATYYVSGATNPITGSGTLITPMLIVDLTTPIAVSSAGYLLITNVEISSASSAVNLNLYDAVLNPSAMVSTTITTDATKPDVTSFALNDGANASHSDGIVSATGYFSENESGVVRIAFTGDVNGFSAPTVVSGSSTYTVGGTTYALSVSGNQLLLSPPLKGSAAAYTITGIKLKTSDGDGSKSVSVVFTNNAELAGDGDNDTINLDLTSPTATMTPTGANVFPLTATSSDPDNAVNATYFVKGSDSITFNWTGLDSGTTPSGIAGYSINAGATSSDIDGAASFGIDNTTTPAIRSVDLVGNASKPINITVTRDDSKPTLSLTPPGTASVDVTPAITAASTADLNVKCFTKLASVDFAFTTGDVGSLVKSYTNGATHTTIPSSLPLAASVGGTLYTIYATDNLGNVSHAIKITVYQDVDGPTMTVSPPATGVYPTDSGQAEYFTAGSTIAFSVASTDQAGVIPCTVSGGNGSGSVSGSSSPYTVTLAPNASDYVITAKDSLGNPSTFTVKVTQDASPPAISVKSPSTGTGISPLDTTTAVPPTAVVAVYATYYTTGDSIAFTFEASDLELDTYTIDGTTVSPVTNTVAITKNLSSGTGDGTIHTIFAEDKLGQTTKDLRITVIKDEVKPLFSLTPSASYPATIAQVTSATTADVAEIDYFTKNNTLSFAFATSDINRPGTAAGSGVASYTDNGSTHTTIPDPLELTANGTAHVVSVTDKLGYASYTVTVKATKDSAGPTITLTPPATGVLPATTNQATYRTKASFIEFAVNANDGTGSGPASCTVTGGDGAGTATFVSTGNWTVRLNASANDYTITTTDNLGTATTRTVTVTQDVTPPSFGDWGAWNGSSNYSMNNIAATASDVAIASYKAGTAGPPVTISNVSDNLTGLSYDTLYIMALTDDLGNKAEAYFMAVYDSSNCKLIRINAPALWALSGNLITGLGIYKTSDAPTGTWVDVVTPATNGTVNIGTSQITDFPDPHGSTYRLVLALAGKSLVVNFVGGTTTATALSIFGNSAIGERITGKAVTDSIRKSSFEEARRSSSTNLPVWFSAPASRTSSSQASSATKASGRKAVEKSITGKGSAVQSMSVEGLHASSLAALRSEKSNSAVLRDSSRAAFDDSVYEGDGNEGNGNAGIMLAPEGSPAFVAYARGIAALERTRSGADSGVSWSADESRKVGIWEKLLALFGIRDAKGGADNESA